MQLTYRGINYTPSTEVEVSRNAKLVYRGVAFERSSAPISPATVSPISLTYRGVNYTRPATPALEYCEPLTINGCYQVA